MPESLTPKQERFVLALVAGMSQREAYRSAYHAGRMSSRTVDKKASLLFNQGEIRGRYDELVARAARAAEWTRVRAARDLLDVLEVAMTHIRATVGNEAHYTTGGSRQLADFPANSARAALGAIEELNRMFDVYDARGDRGGGEPVIIDDFGQR